MADAMELSEQVHDICDREEDPSVELEAFLEAHPEVSVNQYRDTFREQALHSASTRGHAACVRMLLDDRADVHARNKYKCSPLIYASSCDRPECVEILIEA